MSFGEGNLHDEIDRLKDVNGSLCAEINRQERVIERLRGRVDELSDLLNETRLHAEEFERRYRALFEREVGE